MKKQVRSSILLAMTFAAGIPQAPAAETLVTRLLAGYDRIQTVSCNVRRESESSAAKGLTLSRVYYQKPDCLHVENFQPEIERTARQLHDKLQEQPRVLNTLRATRATTDAVGLALALNTGGLGVQDFIIAPAILSFTSLLAESALGHYMHRAEAELKARQFRETQKLFDEVLRPMLDNLPTRMQPEGRFNISAEMLDAAEGLLNLP